MKLIDQTTDYALLHYNDEERRNIVLTVDDILQCLAFVSCFGRSTLRFSALLPDVMSVALRYTSLYLQTNSKTVFTLIYAIYASFYFFETYRYYLFVKFSI
jgi:hypothetical protein